MIQLDVKPVRCIWACDHGCVVAVSSPKKPTYLIVDLQPDESADFSRYVEKSIKNLTP